MGSPFIAATRSPFDLVRRQRAQLLASIRTVEGALTGPVDPGWQHTIAERLAVLRDAFADHVSVTEGADGLYAELIDHAPRLAPEVSGLTREHASLGRAIDELRQRSPVCAPDELRGGMGRLLRELTRHRQRGADLVYDAYQTDLGGET